MNLQNLVDYCKLNNLPSPFVDAYVPEPLNLETCLSAIMIRCGLLTPIYGDPETFRQQCSFWFATKQWSFRHLIAVIEAEYNPIENVFEDRTETTTYASHDTHTGGYKDSGSGKDTVTDSGTDTEILSGTDTEALSGTDQRDISDSGTDTTTNTISAFNSSTYQPDNQSALEHGKSVDDDITYGKSTDLTYGKQTDTTYGKQTDTTYGKSITRAYENDKISKGGYDELHMSRHGNIGTVSAQSLINEELELLRHFDVYGYIAEMFENDNMLMIY